MSCTEEDRKSIGSGKKYICVLGGGRSNPCDSPVMAIGQAAGVAAALSIKEQCSVRMVDVQKLRQLLKEQKAYLGEV